MSKFEKKIKQEIKRKEKWTQRTKPKKKKNSHMINGIMKLLPKTEEKTG